MLTLLRGVVEVHKIQVQLITLGKLKYKECLIVNLNFQHS